MRTGHLFAGAGGGILADIILGHSPIWAVELDPYCCAVLRERFPHMHIVCGDVRDVDFSALADVDAICGGFPCQDISAAGKQAGITGERSGLFREIMRAIDDLRPAWVFLENSPNIRTKGRHVVIAELVARGYSWRDGILAASDVGAPHQRKRWWCLANSSSRRRGGAEVGQIQQPGRAETFGTSNSNRTMADATSERLEKPQPSQEINQEPSVAGSGRVDDSMRGRHGLQDEEIPAGRDGAEHAGWWATEPGMGRMAHGVANRTQRIKALGNGQVPLCAAVAWRLLGGP